MNQTRIIVTIEIEPGKTAEILLPADTTHLSRNDVETIEDGIAQARRGPQSLPDWLAERRFDSIYKGESE